MSHAAGVGAPFDAEIVRAAMTLRLKDFARGHSGIRLATARHLLDLLNGGITPVVPEKGSVGASGDLAPLAHMALVLLGQGEAFHEGRRISGAEALAVCGLAPLQLESAEGLALVNGTQVMTAVGGLAVYDAIRLSRLTDIAASMSLEVLMGSRTEFNPPSLTRKAGRPLRLGLTSRSMRRSEMLASSATAMPMKSMASATGCP